jgi:hypothetical protein
VSTLSAELQALLISIALFSQGIGQPRLSRGAGVLAQIVFFTPIVIIIGATLFIVGGSMIYLFT